jgi:hypothetical protein
LYRVKQYYKAYISLFNGHFLLSVHKKVGKTVLLTTPLSSLSSLPRPKSSGWGSPTRVKKASLLAPTAPPAPPPAGRTNGSAAEFLERRDKACTNFSYQDYTRTEFSTIDVVLHQDRWIRTHYQNGLTRS